MPIKKKIEEAKKPETEVRPFRPVDNASNLELAWDPAE